ncbi:hypothetical protein IQ273_06275 [Nodosilinea sp. LEGE 07298]|uniref:hypothetical protein n=1 Tax=Nodosilinea sp. LEGE 07298 TaxID=2777970 RepID=UPI00187E9803|nr:hypothetical protein [Nodosilinea sp. LEGE 07298]MBE9109023.1 hypothetical protein [Nodosilinea sp. LEGE 07298]
MQTSPIACRPLADWVGQTVRFQGYLNYWETANRTDDTAFLLQHVKVVPYKGCEKQIRTLDHIWLYSPKEAHANTKLERLNAYGAVGKVVSYIRSNGTKDFAINVKSFAPMAWHLELLDSYGESKLDHIKARTLVLEETLNALESEELHFDIHLSYEEVYQDFQDEYEFCRRHIEINERYEVNKQHRSKPKPDILKFASTSSKSTKLACKGFAAS